MAKADLSSAAAVLRHVGWIYNNNPEVYQAGIWSGKQLRPPWALRQKFVPPPPCPVRGECLLLPFVPTTITTITGRTMALHGTMTTCIGITGKGEKLTIVLLGWVGFVWTFTFTQIRHLCSYVLTHRAVFLHYVHAHTHTYIHIYTCTC